MRLPTAPVPDLRTDSLYHTPIIFVYACSQMKMTSQRTAANVQMQVAAVEMQANFTAKLAEKTRELTSGNAMAALAERIEELEAECGKIKPLEDALNDMATRSRRAETSEAGLKAQARTLTSLLLAHPFSGWCGCAYVPCTH